MARIFITGSADGLGLAAARTLIDDGHQVVVHVRSPQRLAAVQELLAQDEWGRQVLRLRRERERLRERVALAFAAPPLQELWQQTLAFLGEQPAPLQRDTLPLSRDETRAITADSSRLSQP